MKTRDEHLRWCKDRALEYWRAGDLQNACVSMVSDLEKHEETKNSNSSLLALGIIYVTNNDYDGMKRWIEGWR
jgi:hypothetical protein